MLVKAASNGAILQIVAVGSVFADPPGTTFTVCFDEIADATTAADLLQNQNLYTVPSNGTLFKSGVQVTLSATYANQAAALTAQLRKSAVTASTDPAFQYKLDRAIVILAVNQINLLRERCIAQDAVIAAAFTTFADLQSRWATMATAHPLPDVTLAQAITAIQNKINDGTAD